MSGFPCNAYHPKVYFPHLKKQIYFVVSLTYHKNMFMTAVKNIWKLEIQGQVQYKIDHMLFPNQFVPSWLVQDIKLREAYFQLPYTYAKV